MPVIATCQECEAKLKFPDTAAGKKVRCPKCKGVISLENAKPVEEGFASKSGSRHKAAAKTEHTTADDFDLDDDAGRSGRASRRSRSEDSYEDEPRERRTSGRRQPWDDDREGERDYDDPRERRSPKRGMSKGTLGGLIGGGVAMLAGLGIIIYLLATQDDASSSGSGGGGGGGIAGKDRGRPSTRKVSSIDEALTAMKTTEWNQQREALQYLDKTPVNAGKQAEVATALNPLFTSRDSIVANLATKVAYNWGTTANASSLMGVLKAKPRSVSEAEKNAIKALAKLKPAGAAKAIAPYLSSHSGYRDAEQALTALGPQAEVALLDWINHPEGDAQARERARNLLKKLPDSEKKMLTQIVKDLRSSDKKRKDYALDSLASIAVKPDQQGVVVAGLLTAVKDGQGRYSDKAIQQLAKWGDKEQVPLFLQVLEDPSTDVLFRGAKRAALNFVKKHPSPEVAEVFVRLLANSRAKLEVTQALKTFPPEMVEAGAIKSINDKNRILRAQARELLRSYIPKPEAIAKQIADDLTSEIADVRLSAVEYAEKADVVDNMREEIADELAKMAASQSFRESRAAAPAFIKWATKKHLPKLVELVLDKRRRLTIDQKRKGIEALSNFKDPQVVTPIALGLLDLSLRPTASAALIKLGPIAEEIVATFLRNRDAILRAEACRILGQIGTEKVLPALKMMIKDRQILVRKSAQDAVKLIEARTKPETPEKK